MIDDFFIRPSAMLVYRGRPHDVAPEVLVTQWPGGGYTFQAQEVMRCLRAGERESFMVPWGDSLAVARTLALWHAAVSDAAPERDGPAQEGITMERLTGVVQPYAWGSRTAIPEFLGVAPSGEPQAELWFGAHPLAPSTVDGEPLDKLVAHDPVGVVGAASVDAFGPRLPFLLKVIAAAQPLSLQAHPSREEAEAGFESEQAAGICATRQTDLSRQLAKAWVLCALVTTEALCGFREPDETYQMFAELGVADTLDLVGPLADAALPGEERLAAVFARLLRLTSEQRCRSPTWQAAEALQASDELALFGRTAIELNASIPTTPGYWPL
jgi:mannose-6-phosphate isomerase